ncbi:hypothetical protein LZZ85_10655 [Terrimonas sp. NA20]|uniref:Outer membrane protein beta-barrel domain-containing protein n=1 Tax=Terrimonas ginsenosidimutans TaxID=2908004 RepID=A0ABS9KR32_9BACT|nr:hypothetical protein [Terrimonas ginsenosidimutans]MCG2614745.1 hypothetical protein [Terrimonas ginsenosidimutans]
MKMWNGVEVVFYFPISLIDGRLSGRDVIRPRYVNALSSTIAPHPSSQLFKLYSDATINLMRLSPAFMKSKHLLIALPLLCLAGIANAQRTTFSVGLNSGLFSYRGDQAFSIENTQPAILRTNFSPDENSRSGFSYEVNSNVQYVSKTKLIVGGEVAFQSLQSKSTVTYLSPSIFASALIPAEGSAESTSQYICITPFIGFRALDKKLKIDITTGFEIASAVSRKEKIDVRLTMNGDTYNKVNDLSKQGDQRVRIQVTASLNRWGLTTGYVQGYKNYYGDNEFLKARAQFVRMGLTYRIR